MLHLDYLKYPISTASWHLACAGALTSVKWCCNLQACNFFSPFKLKSTRICHSSLLPQCLAHYRQDKKKLWHDSYVEENLVWKHLFRHCIHKIYCVLPKLVLTMALFTIFIYNLDDRMVTSNTVIANNILPDFKRKGFIFQTS